MYLFQEIYTFFHSFFKYLTFRPNHTTNTIEDIENQPDYEFIILHNKMIR
jgi:hypothetical protein